MSLPEIQPFNEPKPPMFPLIRDTSPDKVWDLEKVESFGDKLAQKLTPLTAFQKEELIEQQKATLYSTLQMAALEKGTEHLGLNVLTSIEQVHTRQNQERVESKAYIDYRALLREGRLTRAGVAAVIAEVAAKKKQKDKVKDAQEIRDEIADAEELPLEDTPGKGFTYVHNLNLYAGASSSNPFKKGDTKNYQAFEKNKYFDVLTDNFMSPLRVLGTQNWQLGNSVLSKMQSKSLEILGVLDPFQDSGTETFDIKSNYNSMLSNTELMKSLDDSEVFGFFLKRWSDVKNYDKTLNTFTGRNLDHQDITDEIIGAEQAKSNAEARKKYLGNIQDILNEMDKISIDDALSGKLDNTSEKLAPLRAKAVRMMKVFGSVNAKEEDKAAIQAQQQELDEILAKSGFTFDETKESSTELEKAKAWWNTIGSKVPTAGMLIPFGLMAETAGAVSGEMNLGNWDKTSTSSIADFVGPEKDGVMDKAISGYLRYLKNNEFSGTKGIGIVTELMLAIDDISYGRDIFNKLVSAGYITGEGLLTNKVNSSLSVDDFTLDVNPTEKERILGVLNKSLGGNLNLDKLDKTEINGKDVQNIRLTLPNGSSMNMEELFDLIGKGNSGAEKYSNARDAYNVLFDMMSSMMNLGMDANGCDGSLKTRKTDSGKVAVDVYPKGSWREWSVDADGVGQWISVQDKPVTMEFNSLSEANQFFEKIKKNVALLEPVVASFAPPHDSEGLTQKSLIYQNGEPTESTLRLLTDNEGQLSSKGVIKAGTSEHRYFVDTLQNPNYFKTESWQNVSKFLSKEIAFSLGKEIFTKSMQNKMQQAKHRQQLEDYKEKKEEYEEGEYDRIKEEMKKENSQKAEKHKEEKEFEKKQENERKQIEEADRKRAESQRDKENKERQARQKKSSSDKE